MGNIASNGRNNDELVDNLVEAGSVTKKEVELAMRLVDRGRYLPEEYRSNAYKDSAWKSEVGDPGSIHLSAPCIYASVLENLDAQKGMSFLNIGSGTGYLSSMVGFLLGSNGLNHGIELYHNLVEYALERVDITLKSSEVSAFDWCIPQFFVGNAFQISTKLRYDRIYCGAWVQPNRRSYFCNMLKIGGVFIVPYGDTLQRIVRQSDNRFEVKNISSVTFAHLIQPGEDANSLTNISVELPLLQPCRLLDICRTGIRQEVREQAGVEVKLDMRYHVKNHREEIRARRRRRMPMVFLERGQERGDVHDENDDDDDRRALFAMLNERLNRHHAARARGAAAVADQTGNREAARRNRGIAAAEVEPQMFDDTDFEAIGFHFDIADAVNRHAEDIPEPNLDQNRGRQIGQNLLVRLRGDVPGRVDFRVIAGDFEDEDDVVDHDNAPFRDHALNLLEGSPERNSERNVQVEPTIEDDNLTPREGSLHGEDVTSDGFPTNVSNIAVVNEESSGSTSSQNCRRDEDILDRTSADSGNGKRARPLTSQSEHLARKIKRRSVEDIGEGSGPSTADEQKDMVNEESRESLNLELDDGIGHALDEPPSDIDASTLNDIFGDDSDASHDMTSEDHNEEEHDELGSASLSTGESTDIERELSMADDLEIEHGETQEDDDVEEKEADQSEGARLQALSLASFHTMFCKTIDELPLTKNMKEFLKYRISR